MRLIDADKIDWKRIPMDMGGLVFLSDVQEKIARMPNTEVVCCKDCKYAWHSFDGIRCEFWGTYKADPIIENVNGFCSNGAKMDEVIE